MRTGKNTSIHAAHSGMRPGATSACPQVVFPPQCTYKSGRSPRIDEAALARRFLSFPHMNVHGDRLFLVKMQNRPGLVPRTSDVNLYVRRMMCVLLRGFEPCEVRTFAQEVRGPRGGEQGRKVYR
ncbi:hypothetical protein BD310DRAFT_244876 [Dichomitus squalens]|uniref:Uncharacterized protein n=1 Tax=Dichomitus squalens TaxID=114155 RepID=A0A4Q9PCF8_9APHY|nr:hypothetical protein BD310DRAFT_244876 [Dichomitus squalens]